MVEENNFGTEEFSDFKSELYALVQTIINANSKFEQGTINNNFFRKTVKNAIKELLKFNIELEKREIELANLLKKMGISPHYFKAIEIINKLSSLEFSSEQISHEKSTFSQEINPDVLELPGITLEITSSFITLMDMLKLKGFQDDELIDKLFKELIKNLKRFPGLNDLLLRIEVIQNHALMFETYEERTGNFNEIIVDEIYNEFIEFQKMLNLKPIRKQ
ncbi:MAG: hypothetical protein ACW986_03115 [Promethearchaeota archaeon]|jgi:hypothetical protein